MTSVHRRPPVPDLDTVLQDLYGALAEDLSFFHCLETIATPLRSHITAVQHEDYDAHRSWLELIGEMSKDEMTSLSLDYAKRWHGQNLWLNRGLHSLLTRGYGEGDEVASQCELFATPYYQHFLKPADVRHGLGICLWHEGPGKLAVATFNRHASEGPFRQETMAFVGALRPHLVNVYSIYRHATQLEDANRSLRASMDRAPVGMLVLEMDGRIRESNAEAERLLAMHAGISRNATGVAVLERFADQSKFLDLLRELASCADGTLTRSLVVNRPARSAAEGLVLHLCAVPARPMVASTARVIAFLSPMSGVGADKLDLLILQSALMLTPAEARVLIELRRSHDLQIVADALGLSASTVRTHLKHVFAKTDTRKQSELLVIADRVVSASPGPAQP